MNKVFKVIWSEARNAYVVVSEMAKSHGTKSCSTKKLLAMLIATGVMTCASMAPAMAGNPAPDDLNVTIGKGAHVSVWNGVSGQTISGDIAVGPKAYAWNGEYTYDDKYARIGSNNDGIYSTTLGAGAYNSGSLAAVTGALSIASGKDTKNTGATIYGSMNSIESATSSSDYSGVASSVLGFANRT